MSSKKVEKELLNEQLAQKIASAVGKLVSFWRQSKAQAGASDFVLDQASSALKRSIMSSFADVNRRLDRKKFSDVEKQKTGGELSDFIREAIFEEMGVEPAEEDEHFMVKGNLRHLADYAQHLYDEIDQMGDIEEWVQEKIAIAASDLSGIRHYYEQKLHQAGHEHEATEDEMVSQELSEQEENNPWAICTASVGREDKEKYERCVKDVKKQNESLKRFIMKEVKNALRKK